MKLSEINIQSRAVRPFRKQLSKLARQGKRGVRLVGQRGAYFFAVEHGSSVVIVSPQFGSKTAAQAWNERKHQHKPPTRVLAFAA